MRNTSILDALIPRTRQGILAALLIQPEKPWYVSELARRMGVPSSSLQRELHALSDAGILKTHRQEIGRASCRERVKIEVGDGAVQRKREKKGRLEISRA